MLRFGTVFALGALVIALASPANASATATCVAQAEADFKDCTSQCRDDLIAEKLTCKNINPACGAACLAGRTTCLDVARNILKTGVLPDSSTLANCTGGTDACDAQLAAAENGCGAPCNITDQTCNNCVDAAQLVALTCRDECRDSWRTNPTVVAMKKACDAAFRNCVKACPPANP
jgi:hypothetical protein